MITKLYELTIQYDENNGEWSITDYGSDEDAAVTTEEKSFVMLEHHDEICRHVDRLCREIAAESQDCTDYLRAQEVMDYRKGL